MISTQLRARELPEPRALVGACVEIKSSTRLQCARMRPFRREAFCCASRTRREQSIRPKISRIDFDLIEIKSSEVWWRPPKAVIDFHTGCGAREFVKLHALGLQEYDAVLADDEALVVDLLEVGHAPAVEHEHLCGNQTVSWVIPTKLQNSLARSNRSRFG